MGRQLSVSSTHGPGTTEGFYSTLFWAALLPGQGVAGRKQSEPGQPPCLGADGQLHGEHGSEGRCGQPAHLSWSCHAGLIPQLFIHGRYWQ